jgi:hypothetical protein
MHALAILHIFAIGGLLVWWSLYFWRHTPARDLLARKENAAAAHGRRGSGDALGDPGASDLGRRAREASAAVALAVPDVLGGLVVLSLFAVATGIYVRRFEVWLQARGSGETMTFAGTGLDDKVLAANKAGGSRR